MARSTPFASATHLAAPLCSTLLGEFGAEAIQGTGGSSRRNKKSIGEHDEEIYGGKLGLSRGELERPAARGVI